MEITNQYMEYIHEMERQDLDIMSEFMVMAATLIDIKAKMLLPKKAKEEEEETDPRTELVMKRQMDKLDPVRSRFGRIEKEEISLEEKIVILEQYAAVHKQFSFRGLLEQQCSRVQVIVTFLAILELMKTGKIEIFQKQAFDDISITSHISAA